MPVSATTTGTTSLATRADSAIPAADTTHFAKAAAPLIAMMPTLTTTATPPTSKSPRRHGAHDLAPEAAFEAVVVSAKEMGNDPN